MSFKVGDTVRYIGVYSDLYRSIGKVAGYSTYLRKYVVDFGESGFKEGHSGAGGMVNGMIIKNSGKTSCWWCSAGEIEPAKRKLMVYRKEGLE